MTMPAKPTKLKSTAQEDASPNQPRKQRGSGNYAKGVAKREAILSGLMDALAKGTLRSHALKDISKTLGIDAAHILYYFKSREDLIKAVITRWDEVSSNYIASQNGGIFSLDVYCDLIKRNISMPGVVHLYLSFAAEAVSEDHSAHQYFRDRFSDLAENLAAAISREQEAGTISSALDPDLEARLLIADADGLQLQSLIDSGIAPGDALSASVARLRRVV
jgi:AcrR family transcriptional regulator